MKTNTDILLIDVETTGIDPLKHACIEIGAVLLDRDLNPIKEYTSFICPWPGAEVQPEAMAVNQITQAELDSAPPLNEVVERFHCIFQPDARKLLLSGWNVWFDAGFLRVLYSKANLKWPFRARLLDIQSLVTFHSQITPQSQADAAKRLLTEGQTHRALDDVRQSAKILNILANKYGSLPIYDSEPVPANPPLPAVSGPI